jgi:uncharacterized repeat protein (TIGR01451 family)
VTERISVSSDEAPQQFAGGGFGSMAPAITGDGRFVAFQSDAVNFTATSQTQGFSDVFVRDRQAGTTELASPRAGTAEGEANGQSQGPDLSPDGRFVSFASFATDLTDPADTDELLLDAFVRDRQAGTTEMVSVSSTHADAMFGPFHTHAGTGPVSADGLVSLFGTNADNLSTVDDNLSNDVYANDRRPGTDLSLAKLDMPDPVAGRAMLTYTLTAANDGANPAPAAGIRDTLPAGVTFVSATAGCSHVAGVVDCELGTLSPGDSATVTIVVEAPRRAGTITNTAVVASAVSDPDASDNTATATTAVVK